MLIKMHVEKKSAYSPTKVGKLQPLGNTIIVSDMKFDIRLSTGGIILPNDDMKNSGIRPRWAKVYAIGPEQKDINVGEYILISHGRWTRGVKIEDQDGEKTIRKVDPNDILLVSNEPMEDETMSDKVY
jgi:co-chaperonin GroES (HSP10)